MALRICQHKQTHGPFHDLEDFKKVPPVWLSILRLINSIYILPIPPFSEGETTFGQKVALYETFENRVSGHCEEQGDAAILFII
jgi:hypothetical protein